MVAEFRARMVGRVAILAEVIEDGYESRDHAMSRAGVDEAITWVRDRYPHLTVQDFGEERPELVAGILDHHRRFSTLQWVGQGERAVVVGIELEDDQQATDFKLRWV